MNAEEQRLMELLIKLKIWNPKEKFADLTVAAHVIDELQKRVAQLEANKIARG